MQIFKFKKGIRFDMGKGYTLRVFPPGEGAKNLSLNYSEFEPGQAFNQHIHQKSEDVIVVLKGKGWIRVEGVDYPIEEGDVIYIPPGEQHGTIAETTMVMFSCQAPPDVDLYQK